jgi:hypothetical protein
MRIRATVVSPVPLLRQTEQQRGHRMDEVLGAAVHRGAGELAGVSGPAAAGA